MTWQLALTFVLLGLYSLGLMLIEVLFSHDYVRHFFTDIRGPVPFYAINTTLSVFFLWATALIFVLCVVSTEAGRKYRRERQFYISQICIFAYLGADERFMFHERWASWLGIKDAFFLLGVGVLEVGLLLFLGQVLQQRHWPRQHLYVASMAFMLMVVIDAFFPERMLLRLSVEDLAKLWGTVLLFLFSWGICCGKITALKANRPFIKKMAEMQV
jgi:hypothetical protein